MPYFSAMYKRMKRAVLTAVGVCTVFVATAQAVSANLAKVWTAFESDPQLRSAMASLYVIDAATGAVVFDRNGGISLAPASTQKVITAAAAYELLGKDFRYQTTFATFALPAGSLAPTGLVVRGSGDPTLGSWRWKQTTTDSVLDRVAKAFAKTGVKRLGLVMADAAGWEGEDTPGGWIWDDIGNYYGAGAAVLNWHENQYDLVLRSADSVGGNVVVVGMRPAVYFFDLFSEARAAAKGTGDNAYIYFRHNQSRGVVRGTIPVGENAFTISGAMPTPVNQFLNSLTNHFAEKRLVPATGIAVRNGFSSTAPPVVDPVVFHTETSPPLDSICHWFLKRSINLYGEALAKTMAAQAGKTATAANGVGIIENFWTEKNIGIDRSELNLHDGSGLSPLNRTTARAQVRVLHYAKKQPWFAGYAAGFPAYNGMQLKSGTISGVKSFCGYHTSKAGVPYIVSFIVNNYNGSAALLVQKMYKVLDVLK